MYQESAISVSTTELKGTIMSSVRTHQALTEHANSDEWKKLVKMSEDLAKVWMF